MTGPVVADTNALMMPVESDVRLFDELARVRGDATVLVPRPVVDELTKLADGSGDPAAAASVGLDLVDRCAVRNTEESYADDAVVELAVAEDAPVVTNDRPLRDRLLDRGVRVIGLRGRNRLHVTQP
ncbi:MAG: PIN domain-containing protein [Halolamina sp.]